MTTLRLLKVIVQPRPRTVVVGGGSWLNNELPAPEVEDFLVQAVLVIDDGETLLEQVTEPVVVPADEMPTYATGRFADDFAALRRQVELMAAGDSEDPS